MNKAHQVKVMENRTKDKNIVFFKSQEDFAKALREGIDEKISFTEELAEEE